MSVLDDLAIARSLLDNGASIPDGFLVREPLWRNLELVELLNRRGATLSAADTVTVLRYPYVRRSQAATEQCLRIAHNSGVDFAAPVGYEDSIIDLCGRLDFHDEPRPQNPEYGFRIRTVIGNRWVNPNHWNLRNVAAVRGWVHYNVREQLEQTEMAVTLDPHLPDELIDTIGEYLAPQSRPVLCRPPDEYNYKRRRPGGLSGDDAP